MNATKFLFIILLTLAGMGICPSWGKPLDNKAFIEALREHNKNGTQLEFSEQLRKTISQDKSGDLIIAISEDAELNSAIYYNLDVVPERMSALVIALWLEDDYQWGARGGMYYSPATGIVQALRRSIRPSDAEDPDSIKNILYVLQDKGTRLKMAKVLRACYSDEELDSDESSKRRTEAWGRIVYIVEKSFPVLLEEDTKRRAEAAGEPRPEPGLFLKKLRQESSDDVTTNQPSGQANNSNISLRPEKRHDATPDKISKAPYASGKFIYWLMTALALVIFVTAMIILFKRRNA